MYGKGCPHDQTFIDRVNGELGGYLVTPEMIADLEQISKKVLEILDKNKIHEGIGNSYEVNDLNGWNIIQSFIKIFRKEFHIPESEIPFYTEYRKRKFGNLEGDIPSLIGYAFSDIYFLLLLHVNLGVPLSQIKGIILRTMLSGSAEYTFTPSGIISSAIESKNPQESLEKIMEKLKKSIPQQLHVHEYGEPSCPFLLSKDIDDWLNKVIKYILDIFIPEIQKQYTGKCRNFAEAFFSGNYKK